jgi:hypothetical protein
VFLTLSVVLNWFYSRFINNAENINRLLRERRDEDFENVLLLGHFLSFFFYLMIVVTIFALIHNAQISENRIEILNSVINDLDSERSVHREAVPHTVSGPVDRKQSEGGAARIPRYAPRRIDLDKIKQHWSDIKPEWNEVASTDWGAFLGEWTPKWKPVVFCLIILVGVWGVISSLLGHAAFFTWGSSIDLAQLNFNARSWPSPGPPISALLLNGLIGIALLDRSLVMYHSRKVELLEILAAGDGATADATVKSEPVTEAVEPSGDPKA